MAHVRVRKDGCKTVANTIYLTERTDAKAARIAKDLSRNSPRKVSKSAVIVDTVEKHL